MEDFVSQVSDVFQLITSLLFIFETFLKFIPVLIYDRSELILKETATSRNGAVIFLSFREDASESSVSFILSPARHFEIIHLKLVSISRSSKKTSVLFLKKLTTSELVIIEAHCMVSTGERKTCSQKKDSSTSSLNIPVVTVPFLFM
jgi:hypothetical protein